MLTLGDILREDSPVRETGESFEDLLDAYLDRIVRYAFRRLGSLQDAEDVAQETFTRAYGDCMQQGKVLEHAGAYLYRIAGNLCIDHLRKRKFAASSIDDVGELTDGARRPDEEAGAQDEIRRIEDLLRRIPRKQAEVVRLRVFDDLSLSEIAGIVGCSLATVKSRLRYGIEKLRPIVLQEWEVSK